MALSQWDPDQREGWLTTVIPVYERRRRTGLLTPYGWLIVLSLVSVALGAVLAFVT